MDAACAAASIAHEADGMAEQFRLNHRYNSASCDRAVDHRDRYGICQEIQANSSAATRSSKREVWPISHGIRATATTRTAAGRRKATFRVSLNRKGVLWTACVVAVRLAGAYSI